MRQGWSWRPPSAAWRGLQLLITANILALCLADGKGHAGDTVHGPDPATMFEVQGRTFWNKSLGLDQLPHGILGHQCSSARPGPYPTEFLTYTPNRRHDTVQTMHHVFSWQGQGHGGSGLLTAWLGDTVFPGGCLACAQQHARHLESAHS